jgi:hypothetical protein
MKQLEAVFVLEALRKVQARDYRSYRTNEVRFYVLPLEAGVKGHSAASGYHGSMGDG